MIKYVFFGTPRFAEIVLGRLIAAGMPPVALVANPDRPVGRKKIVTPPPTKELITKAGFTTQILQPEALDAAFIETLRALDADLFIVAAYAKIIPKAVLDIPRFGTLGVHPSLLPKYRGASPIQSVILNGEKETGGTLYQMDEKMDHGPILARVACDAGSGRIPYPELEYRLAALSAELLLKVMPNLLSGKTAPQSQDEPRATYTKKFVAQDGFIDEKDLTAAEGGDAPKAEAILWKINALNPEPGVWTIKNGKRVKLLAADLRGKSLRILRAQEAGGKPQAHPKAYLSS